MSLMKKELYMMQKCRTIAMRIKEIIRNFQREAVTIKE